MLSGFFPFELAESKLIRLGLIVNESDFVKLEIREDGDVVDDEGAGFDINVDVACFLDDVVVLFLGEGFCCCGGLELEVEVGCGVGLDEDFFDVDFAPTVPFELEGKDTAGPVLIAKSGR